MAASAYAVLAAGTVTVIAWHVPAIFELALQKSQIFGISSKARQFFLGGNSVLVASPAACPVRSAGPFRFNFSLRPYLATPYRHFWHFVCHVVYRPYMSIHDGSSASLRSMIKLSPERSCGLR